MRRALLAAVLALALLAVPAAAQGPEKTAGPTGAQAAPDPAAVARGQALFSRGCTGCHGMDGRGVAGQGPTLVGAGAAAADFYLGTGRMPLNGEPGSEPLRGEPAYSDGQIADIAAWVASLGPGPAIPAVDPARGDLSEGMELFTVHCAGCHQVVARGGLVTKGAAPSLQQATPQQVGEAIRVGPYTMPVFTPRVISDAQVDSIAAYVELAKDPVDRGGAGLGNVGPVPEGMVAWIAALGALLIVARIIGERAK
ncbi:MAG TPA: c-type cytochrome [Miltoncostaea sp.]|nr:c-type cytochrome [Miltoncostaea sp.]